MGKSESKRFCIYFLNYHNIPLKLKTFFHSLFKMVVAPCKSEGDSEEPELGCCKEGDKEEDEPIVSSSSNVLPIDDPMDSARTDSMDTSGEQVDSDQMTNSSVVFLNDDCCACLDASADPACVLPCGHSC